MSNGMIEKIEGRIDRALAESMTVDAKGGGMMFRSAVEVMEFSKLMAIGGVSVPAHCRGNVGVCLAISIQAIEWRMSPFAVANKSYVVNDRLCFESQLVHAVIEQRAPLTKRLRHSFAGEGGKLTCTVVGYVRGEEEPMEYTSPPLEQIVPKNSPLWKTKPALQLYYNTLRDWARMYFPDVIMGVYTDDEIETHGPQAAPADGAAAKPSLTDRIKARSGSTTATTSAAEPAEQPNAAQWAQYLDMLAKARTQEDVRGLYDDWFGPSSPVRWTDDQAAEAGELATTRIAELPSRAAPARDESSAGSAGSKKKSSG